MLIYSMLLYWIIPFYPKYEDCLHPDHRHTAWILTGLLLTLLTKTFPEAFRFCLPLLLNLSLTDLKYMEIPYICMFLFFLYAAASVSVIPSVSVFLFVCGSAAAYIGKTGFGDVILITLMSMLCAGRIWYVLLIASSACLFCIACSRKPAFQPVPFAPFLSLGFLFTILFL